VLTSLSLPHGLVCSTPRTSTNTALDFLQFVSELVANKHLVAGDILVCDNASIHYGDEIQIPLDFLLQSTGVRLLFMPTYSPELSPCELVFAQVKRHIRHNRQSRHLLLDVVDACASVSWLNVFSYYRKCILNFHQS
jgi:transposase